MELLLIFPNASSSLSLNGIKNEKRKEREFKGLHLELRDEIIS